MAKYIFQLRRGEKTTNSSGTVTKNDWAAYEATAGHKKPLEGELVIEYDNGVPRLKIGDGTSEFSDLPYMSVDSFILPKPATITLTGGSSWIQDVDNDNQPIANRYHQVVTVSNGVVTKKSKVDLQPSPEQLCAFHEKDVAFTTVNNNGTVTVYAVGQAPQSNYTIQVTITETEATANTPIIGDTTATTMPQSDWNQSDSTKADYIKNKPTITTVPTNISAFTNDSGYLTSHQDISGKANSADLATVATSGSYNDLSDKPSAYVLPTGSAEVKGGFKVGAGLAVDGDVLSATGGGTADSVDWSNIQNKPSIPSKTSDLTNDSGFLTAHQSLSGYATESWVENKGYLTSHQDISGKANSVDLATVATSGSYNDLQNTPIIRTNLTGCTLTVNDVGKLYQSTDGGPIYTCIAKTQNGTTLYEMMPINPYDLLSSDDDDYTATAYQSDLQSIKGLAAALEALL